MGPAVSQFEKEVSFSLGYGVGYVTPYCMGRTVCKFEKKVSFRVETGVGYVTSNCTARAVRQFEKEVSSDKEREKYFLTDSFKKHCDRLAFLKMATAVSVESCAQNQTSCPLKINSGFVPKPVQK